MRKIYPIMEGWDFIGPNREISKVNLPHTWNSVDGQDGGDDYFRGTCSYKRKLNIPDFDHERERLWLEFEGVNSSADVKINDKLVCHHDGGYSAFRADITGHIEADEENLLEVIVDNGVNEYVYPQKADFTFYGGIYRQVSLMSVNKDHFDLETFGGPGIRVTAKPDHNHANVCVECGITLSDETKKMKLDNPAGDDYVSVRILDSEGKTVADVMSELKKAGSENNVVRLRKADGGYSGVVAEKFKSEYMSISNVTVENAHLWDGINDPYLYSVVATLYVNGRAVDEISTRFGVRSFYVDPKKGFFLNGRSYPLRGVCRHQDRKGLGNAITRAEHDEDMSLIREMGANTIRLAHYQHDQYFYDLCDEAGMVVWAEIPYISKHMPKGRNNTISQMKELIHQNYNHAGIVCWGISNEITIINTDKKDMLENHRVLNDLCHALDKTRFTTLACYALCSPFNPVAHITDVVSWNLYLGWYVPGLWLNDLWIWFFHKIYPHRALGYSEYGAEAMPNLHSEKPKRNDHSEEYQALYHEYLLRCFSRHPYIWAAHVWNMFDFAADARDQGGEPGMNHKGLVTFDRKIKKDSYYLYKAWLSKTPFVYLTGKRYRDRTEPITLIKVYSNLPKVELYHNGKLVEEKAGFKVFRFMVPLPVEKESRFEAVAGKCRDEMVIKKVVNANTEYKLKKMKKRQKSNWV